MEITRNKKIYDGRLPRVFRMVVSGSSSTGKSHYIRELLENKNGLLYEDFDKIIYVRGVETAKDLEMQEKFGEKLLIFNGIPEEETLLDVCNGKSGKNVVLVIEDLDEEVTKSGMIAKFFTAYSHHLQCSVIFTTQNFFRQGQQRLNIFRNCTHIVLFNINLDETVIRLIALKIYPKNPKSLIALYEKVTEKPFKHLAIFSNCDPDLKFRSETTKNIQKIYKLI